MSNDNPPPQSMLWGRAPTTAPDAEPGCPFSVAGLFGVPVCARTLDQYAPCCEIKPTSLEPDDDA